jgi:hypothetical protein
MLRALPRTTSAARNGCSTYPTPSNSVCELKRQGMPRNIAYRKRLFHRSTLPCAGVLKVLVGQPSVQWGVKARG